MADVTTWLKAFNRKERFFLIGAALGNPSFDLDPHFRAGLDETFAIAIPADAFVAIDYHLDWLHASLFLSDSGTTGAGVFPNSDQVATGTQQDIDLLIAYQGPQDVHIVMIEAKVETGWTNKQTLSKVKRLEAIFGEDGRRYPGVTPRFALLSPRRPQRLRISRWPGWMLTKGRPFWLQIDGPLQPYVLQRCDADGQRSASGTQFRAMQVKATDREPI